MTHSRRSLMRTAMGAAGLLAAPRLARSETYPSRPVRVLVGFAAGGATDIAARVVAQWLADRLGRPFVVENRPGAGGNIATEAVAKSAPDGHTLLVCGVNDAVNATLFDKLNFNFMRDFTSVAGIVSAPNVMVVNPALAVKTVPEFIAHAKSNPGKISMASAGNGSGPHMAGELFKIMAGVDLVHVPYRGGAAAIPDLIAGQVQLMFAIPALTIAHMKSGKLRGLAVTTLARWKQLSDLPTVSDILPGYEATNWFGLVAPAGTVAPIVDRLNSEINAGLADAKIKARIADLGASVLIKSPTEFGKLIAAETKKWGSVTREAAIKMH